MNRHGMYLLTELLLEIERVMVNAAKALSLINGSEAKLLLEKVSHNDPNLKVRQAALAALKS